MDLSINTPALLFPAISLLLLAYTNRFLHLAALVRRLHADYKKEPDPLIIAQIGNLRYRIFLIRWMQVLGVCSILGCTLSMFTLFIGGETAAKLIFSASLLLMIASLALSLREITLSGESLNIQLSDMEQDEAEAKQTKGRF
jgi:hypothetical protein